MLTELPQSIRHGGRIVRRQTTYWDLVGTDGVSTRARFQGKREYHFVSSTFDSAEVSSLHPLLIEYQRPVDELYVTSPCAHPDRLVAELGVCAEEYFGRWRSLQRFLNTSCADRILSDGYGLLLRGPREFVADCAEACSRADTRHNTLLGRIPSPSTLRVLTLGPSYVVAVSFGFEGVAETA